MIFATTTPCPNVTTSMGRTNANVIAYNARALASLPRDVLVDDLYSVVTKACHPGYKSCDLQRPHNVHFEPKGYELLGKAVAAAVKRALTT